MEIIPQEYIVNIIQLHNEKRPGETDPSLSQLPGEIFNQIKFYHGIQ